MTIIKKYVDEIDEELEGAKNYAERYVELKAKGNMQWANKYKEMAQQELSHAMAIHEYATQEIETLKKVYTPPTEMLDKWNDAHYKYVEHMAWIKQMLTL